mgnify:CR=1 FL=1
MSKKRTYILSTILGVFLGVAVVVKLTSPKGEVSRTEGRREDKLVKKPKSIKKIDTKQLNERQKEILKLLSKRQILLPSDIYALHPQVSTRTLRRDMTTLVELNVARQEGTTRDTKYILITE